MAKVSRRERLERQLKTAAARVSFAVRKLASATSSQLGYDCVMHATLGRALLADLDFDAHRVVGYAAWRVGTGTGDVLSHFPAKRGYLPPGVEGFPYHAWLLCHGFVVDFTTYQFNVKAQTLDAFDGGHTTVSWCPDYLLQPVNRIRGHADVAMALRPGVAYYEVRPELESAA